ncbi:MAG: hypothetical protein SAJ12_14815 [Jaaginema sp. PMC 1079.18]|nr:hypothetical protein [Jaaginema sp. PMC 1080.18]MEC4852257.1 hypothetical protein [Jaaginema sp. PMC 1079.18]MEC4865813.1 hypothetical protein [Jaaginema sp. PMC 1078.18]
MKQSKWYLGLVSIFVLLSSQTFSAFALTQSQRHPTEAEIQNVIREFHRFANSAPDVGECCTGSESDSRSSSDKQALSNFSRAWSSVNPNVAPFLGHWINNDADIIVYPSFIRDRVCIVSPYIGGGYAFGVGSLSY